MLACGGDFARLADCEEAKRTNGWCEAANAGYVASLKVSSPLLYEALDTHGHEIDHSTLQCAVCRSAGETGGFCSEHWIGFVDGLAYLSPLTYHLARGEAIEPSSITCPVCRKHTEGIGWCRTHQVGMVGHVAIHDRASFE